MAGTDLQVAELRWDHPDAAALRAAQRAEIAAVYGRDDSEPAGAEAVGADVLCVAYRGGRPVACGAVRVIAPGVGEIKRMYAVPAERGSGAAVAVLRALEDRTRRRGLVELRLETGDLLTAAQRFYRREGYTCAEPWGPYGTSPTSRCFVRRL